MDKNRFKAEVLPLRGRLFGYAVRMLGNSDDAEDIVQEVFLKLWFMRSELYRYNSVAALSYMITKNLSLNHIKTTRRKREKHSEISVSMEGPPPDLQLQEKESLKNVMTIIDNLPGLQQAVIKMRHIEGMEIAEIAQLTGSSPEAIRMSLSRARKRIKELFFEHC
jgi:RNA polymerase sigma factor, sigma-70 family